MWEFERHDWNKLEGYERPPSVPRLLERVLSSSDEDEWSVALELLEAYASDLGIPSEATQGVVGCLVAIAVCTEGRKRLLVLGTLEELTCGRGVEAYTTEQIRWLRAANAELVYALHTWAHLAEAGSREEAVLCTELLAYCAVYVPEVESRAMRYIRSCATARPDLREEVSAVLTNMKIVSEMLLKRA